MLIDVKHPAERDAAARLRLSSVMLLPNNHWGAERLIVSKWMNKYVKDCCVLLSNTSQP